MKIPFLLKSILVGVPIGITFTDCVGYVARVEGKSGFTRFLPERKFETVWFGLFTGVSMQPTLNPNVNSEDYVFLSRWAVKDLYFERGDIISMISPKDQNQRIIKRIIGLQGANRKGSRSWTAAALLSDERDCQVDESHSTRVVYCHSVIWLHSPFWTEFTVDFFEIRRWYCLNDWIQETIHQSARRTLLGRRWSHRLFVGQQLIWAGFIGTHYSTRDLHCVATVAMAMSAGSDVEAKEPHFISITKRLFQMIPIHACWVTHKPVTRVTEWKHFQILYPNVNRKTSLLLHYYG